MGQELRKTRRARVSSVVVRSAGALSTQYVDHAPVDISDGGTFVETDEPLKPGEALHEPHPGKCPCRCEPSFLTSVSGCTQGSSKYGRQNSDQSAIIRNMRSVLHQNHQKNNFINVANQQLG